MEVYFDLLPSISNRSSMNISSHLRAREWSKRRAAAGDSESRFLCRRFSSPGNAKDLGSRDAWFTSACSIFAQSSRGRVIVLGSLCKSQQCCVFERKGSSATDRDLVGHFGCVNAVEFSPDGTTLASGGDDKRILVSRNYCPLLYLSAICLRGQ